MLHIKLYYTLDAHFNVYFGGGDSQQSAFLMESTVLHDTYLFVYLHEADFICRIFLRKAKVI